MRISAALIVRDEEAFLEGCLSSIAGVVGEVIVVDTGSTDRTTEIARGFDVRLLHRVWRDDFAWARNEALAAATGDWILYIDADERLSLPPGATLADGLGDDVAAGLVRFRPKVGFTAYREYRLFRNDPRIRFRGMMHETMLPDLMAYRAATGAREVESPALIEHLGYEGDQSRKHARNLPLLRQAIAETPGNLYLYLHLAETLAGLGMTADSLAAAREGLSRHRGDDPRNARIASGLAFRLALAAHDAGEDAMSLVEQGLRLYPRHLALVGLEARVLIDRGQPEAALPPLAGLCAIDSAQYVDPSLAFDRALFDVHAPDLMGVALLRLGRRAEAAAWFRRAAAAAPNDPSYRIKALALG